MQLAQTLRFGVKSQAALEVLLHLDRAAQVELVVHVGIQQPLRLVADHEVLPACSRRATAAWN